MKQEKDYFLKKICNWFFIFLYLSILVFCFTIIDVKAEEMVIAGSHTLVDGFYSGGNVQTYLTHQKFTVTHEMMISGFKIYFGPTDAPSGSYYFATIKINSVLANNNSFVSVLKQNTNASGYNYFTFNSTFHAYPNVEYILFQTCFGCSALQYFYFASNVNNLYSSGYAMYSSNGGTTYTNYTSNHDLEITFFYENLTIPSGIKPKLYLNTTLLNGSYVDYTPLVFYINGSSVNNSNTYDCSLFVDNVLYVTLEDQNLSNASMISYDLPMNVYDWYDLNVSCENENASTSITYFYLFDSVDLYISMLIQALNVSLYEETENLNNEISSLGNMINILAFVTLWLGLWIFGYYAIRTQNSFLGSAMIVLTLPIDIYFSYVFRELLMLGTGFIGIGFSIFAIITLGALLLIRAPTKNKPSFS